MKITTYFRLSSITARLSALGKSTEVSHIGYVGEGHAYHVSDKDPSLVEVTLYSVVEKLPNLVRGLKPVKVVLRDDLALEQNTHIKQGSKTSGKTHHSVTFKAMSFEVPTNASGYSNAQGFRSVIDIYITGNTLQGVLDSYRDIRKGDGDASWKGSSRPIAVSTSELPSY